MTEEELKAIEERVKAATPGPWGTVKWDDEDMILEGPEMIHLGLADQIIVGKHDADFIAHSRQDVDSLLSEVRRLRALLTPQEQPSA